MQRTFQPLATNPWANFLGGVHVLMEAYQHADEGSAGGLTQKMLKMKVDPAICMKTNGE